MPTSEENYPWRACFSGPIFGCARGELPANVALMQMAEMARDQDELCRVVASACATFPDIDGGIRRLNRLLQETPEALAIVQAILGIAGQGPKSASPDDALRAWADAFDRAVAIAPEASVALYSLGRADLLDGATNEIVQTFAASSLLGPDKVLVEIGCGIGRFMTALAPVVGRIVGVDISAGMLAEARRRCAAGGSVLPLRGSGRDLAFLANESVDLIYAVDSFPYLVDAGAAVVEGHLGDCARALKPGGALIVLNWSYRGDLARDRHEAGTSARLFGFDLLRNGEGGLRHWDGRLFHMRKAGPETG